MIIKLESVRNVFVNSVGKPVSVGVALLTLSMAVVELDRKLSVDACVAVIVAIPAPLIRTVLPFVVATFDKSIVYVNAPELFEEGSMIRKLESVRYVLLICESNPLIIGVALLTVSMEVVELDEKLSVSACVAVIVAVPAPLIITVLPFVTVATFDDESIV